MGVEFNKKLMFDNIAYMLSDRGMKIGELEADAGVSAGYISRTKDGNAKPGIDFIVNVAEALNISLDTLLFVDLNNLTPTERYLVSFFEKLKRDTAADKLDWECSSAESLNNIESDGNGNCEHPLFSYKTIYEQPYPDCSRDCSGVVFTSHSFDCHTVINDDCFSLRLKNGSMLYLMNIMKSSYDYTDLNVKAVEVWMYNTVADAQFLCDNNSGALSALVNGLYGAVKAFSKHPKIRKDLRAAIDAFMRDDLDDDPTDDDGLPF